jgi:hypothetical protein
VGSRRENPFGPKPVLRTSCPVSSKNLTQPEAQHPTDPAQDFKVDPRPQRALVVPHGRGSAFSSLRHFVKGKAELATSAQEHSGSGSWKHHRGLAQLCTDINKIDLERRSFFAQKNCTLVLFFLAVGSGVWNN